jgi:putative ABC transport system permease protein
LVLLRLISWPYARKHALRSLLNLAGIALGVAVWVGIHAANRSVFQAFQQSVDHIAGATQLQVLAGRAGFDETVLERVQAAPEVRVAAPILETIVDTGLRGQGSLLLLGVDLTGDQSLRRYQIEGADTDAIDDPLVFLAQPDSLLVTRQFAARNGLGRNSRLSLATMAGPRTFTVRGLLEPGGLARAYGGNVAVMDLYAAQAILGRGRTIDRIDVALREDVAIDAGRAALERLLGPGFQVETPAARGRQLDSLLRVYAITVNICSLFALFIGMFIIYNSFAVAVAERRSEIGILRALGATQGQIRRLFVAESAAAGLAGSALGIAAGLAMARGMARYIAAVLEGMYGVAEQVERVAAEPGLIAAALGAGTLTSMAAALLPAQSAARVDPTQALQKGKFQILSAGEHRVRRVAGAALGVTSALCLAWGQSAAAFYAGYLGAIVAALFFTPTLAMGLARLLRPLLQLVRPVEGALAADSLLQAPRRTSATVAALMLSLALALGMAGIARGAHASIIQWLQTTLDPDLFVTTSRTLTTAAFRFPATMAEGLWKIEGIARVQAVRSARIRLHDQLVLLSAVDGIEGGRGFVVSENFAALYGARVGENLEVATPRGPLRLPVRRLIRDYQNQQGTIVVDRRLYQEYWSDDTANVFRIYLRPGAEGEAVRRSIVERFGAERRLFVLTNGEVRSYIERVADQWFRVSYVQIAVAVLVALLGIINTLTVSITDRRRELGVLQAVGGRRGQIRGTIRLEAVAIGAIGLVLGLALGALNLYYSLEMVRRDIAGMRFDYLYPAGTALGLAPVILGAALVASLWPAEQALRGRLAEALEYE